MQTKPIQNTAILIFANSAKKDSYDKKIIVNPELFDALTHQTLKTVKATGLPYFHFTENEQYGTTFGQRFVNAIEAVYDEGFENIIAVGNDSPQLSVKHFNETCKQLGQGKAVFGPALDGGFYLMGIHRSHFDASLFMRLPWQHFSLLNSISQLFENNQVCIFKLPALRDIDSLNDIVTLSGYIKTIAHSILTILQNFKVTAVQYIDKSIALLQSSFISLRYNKGSPSFLN